ncbi:unnamed protein product [Oikopleura dioica]|uniref:Uncharacterized protein n=1 Tax=Oikopleura dioica TaxID=34765 RepID=E4XCR6_OIKDI|nr:unnamed protein product [Oikopleura dioica]
MQYRNFFKSRLKRRDLEKLTEDDVFKLLMFAAREGEAEIIRKFVKFEKFRKCFNWSDKNGETAAMKRIASASKFGWIGVFRQLVEVANLDLDAQDNEGNTALIHAAQAGHYEVVELILKQSIDVDQRNHRGFSALMKAAIQGQIESVRFLLGHGADHTITDPTRGMCAQGWAQYCNRHEAAAEIAEFHRRPSSVRLKSHRKSQQGLVLKIHKLVACGCRGLKPDLPTQAQPKDGETLVKSINCHMEKGTQYPECLKSYRRKGSVFSSPRKNSAVAVPKVEITKAVGGNAPSFDTIEK